MHDAVAPVAATASPHVGEHGDAVDIGAGLLGAGPGDDLRAVGAVELAVEAALTTGQALVDDLGGLVDEDAHLARASGELDGLLRRIEHGGLHLQLVGQVGFEDLATLVGVGAVEADHDRGVDLHPLERLHDPVGDLFTLGDAAEDVDEDRAHVGVADDDAQRTGHHVGVGAAPDVEEVRRAATDLVDDVDGAHREPGTVRDHADRAVEPDVLQALLVGELLARVAHLGGVVVGVVGVTEDRVVVERDLGVERVHAPVGREDQRVDLHQVGVAVDVGLVQLHEDVDRALGGGGVELGRRHPLPALRLGEPVDRIDVDLGQGVGVLLRHLLDLHPTLGREHAEVELRRPVEGEGGVVLLGDVARLLDPDHLHQVPLDVHAEDVLGVGARLVGVGRELDAAGLAAPAHLDLGLHDDGIADAVGHLHRLGHRGDGRAVGHGDAVAREQLLALVFEEIHGGESWSIRRPHTNRGTERLEWYTVGRGPRPFRRQAAAPGRRRGDRRRPARRRGAAARDQSRRRARPSTSRSPPATTVDPQRPEERCGPFFVADPFGGDRSILLAIEDGQVVALSDIKPGHQGLPGALAGLDRLVRRLQRRQAAQHRHARATSPTIGRDRRRQGRAPHRPAGHGVRPRPGTGSADGWRLHADLRQGRPRQQQPLLAHVAEVHDRLGLVALARELEDHALAELVVGDVVTHPQAHALGTARAGRRPRRG